LFSSRRRHTRSKRDWSSDVCSSDLSHRHKSGNKDGNSKFSGRAAFGQAVVSGYTHYKVVKKFYKKIKRRNGRPVARAVVGKELRSEERRVGKECRHRWAIYSGERKT